jgi:hypothetical protein
MICCIFMLEGLPHQAELYKNLKTVRLLNNFASYMPCIRGCSVWIRRRIMSLVRERFSEFHEHPLA